MTEETLSEALSNLNDDNIKSAAVPENKRTSAADDPQEESTFIDLTDEDVGEVAPITDDEVHEDFEDGSLGQDDNELSEVEQEAKKAQNRVNQAVKQAKDWQRRELQALQYAKQLQEDNKKLSSQIQLTNQTTADETLKISKSYKDEFEGRVEAEAQSAKASLTKAYESGDPESMADAQQRLARAEAERSSLEQYKRELVKYEEDMQAWNQNQAAQQQAAQNQPQQQQQPPQPQYSEPSQKAQGWAEKNEWFGVDRIMTSTAMVIHQELAESGIDLESNEYYSNLDSRLREELPNRFKAESNAGNSGKPVQTVVSGTRTTGNGRSQNDRRIELTPSEQSLSKRLGVSFKEYAKQKMRLQAS